MEEMLLEIEVAGCGSFIPLITGRLSYTEQKSFASRQTTLSFKR